MPHDHRPTPRLNLCGVHLRSIRRQRRLTLAMLQAELELGYGLVLDRTSLGRIERGTRTVTDIELGAFAQLLNISETELVWGTASPAIEETMKALENVKVRYARSDVAKVRSRATQKKPRSS